MSHFKTPKLSENSKRVYDYNIGRWIGAFKKTVDIMYIVEHLKESLNVLKKCEYIKDTATNRHIFISAIVAYIEHELLDKGGYVERLDEWKKERTENSGGLRERYLTGAPTELQKDKVRTWEDILKVRDGLDVGSTKALLGMYTYINPMRADYYACRLCKEGESNEAVDNYIVMGEKVWKLVIQEYKTAKRYGKIEIEMPNELRELLMAYLKDSTRSYLFVNESDEPFTRKSFSTWSTRRLSAAFGSPCTLTSIRHVYTSRLDFNGSLLGLVCIASGMGHSVSTQRQYRWESE